MQILQEPPQNAVTGITASRPTALPNRRENAADDNTCPLPGQTHTAARTRAAHARTRPASMSRCLSLPAILSQKRQKRHLDARVKVRAALYERRTSRSIPHCRRWGGAALAASMPACFSFCSPPPRREALGPALPRTRPQPTYMGRLLTNPNSTFTCVHSHGCLHARCACLPRTHCGSLRPQAPHGQRRCATRSIMPCRCARTRHREPVLFLVPSKCSVSALAARAARECLLGR